MEQNRNIPLYWYGIKTDNHPEIKHTVSAIITKTRFLSTAFFHENKNSRTNPGVMELLPEECSRRTWCEVSRSDGVLTSRSMLSSLRTCHKEGPAQWEDSLWRNAATIRREHYCMREGWGSASRCSSSKQKTPPFGGAFAWSWWRDSCFWTRCNY